MAPDPAGSATDDDVSVRFGGEADIAECIEILRDVYQLERLTPEWFQWKHVEGPWGPSRILLAEDSKQIVSLAFGMPWRYEWTGGPVEGARTVDGATLDSVRGRGILGRVVALELDRWSELERPGVVMATATPAALRSHVRNGAAALAPLTFSIGVPRSVRSASLITDQEQVLEGFRDAPGAALSTAWDVPSLRWRMDPRSGHSYNCASLRNCNEPNGIVYRIGQLRSVRTVIPLVMWGDELERRRLLGAVARRTRAPLVIAATGPGAAEMPTRAVRGRGSSLLCIWDRRRASPAAPSVTELTGWALGHGELEGVI